MPKQLEFNFDTTSRQLELPFPEWVSTNQETTERLKQEIASGALSESDKLTAQAELLTSKERPVIPNS